MSHMLCFKNDTDDPARTLSGLNSQNHMVKSVFKLYHFRAWLKGTDVTYGSPQTWAELCSGVYPLQTLSLSFTRGITLAQLSPLWQWTKPACIWHEQGMAHGNPKMPLGTIKPHEAFLKLIADEEQKPLVSNSCIIRKLLEFLRHSSQPHNPSS